MSVMELREETVSMNMHHDAQREQRNMASSAWPPIGLLAPADRVRVLRTLLSPLRGLAIFYFHPGLAPLRQARLWAAILRRFAAAALILCCTSIGAFSQAMSKGIMSPPANVRPPGLKNVAVEQRLNEQIPPHLVFRDETGQMVRLGDYFGKRPMILNLVYYQCPMLCGEVLSGLESALRVLKFDIGKEFDVLTISFDPRETPEMASTKKAEFLKRYKRAGAEQGWHFLTGPQESIAALTKVAGFQYEFIEKTGQFAHATAILILTPGGRISQYYYGVEFAPKDLRLGLVQASDNRIGTVVDQVLLYCYHYDPATGKYSAIITRIVRLSAIATILVIGAMFVALSRRRGATI
jgi:protein SCO1